MSEDMKCIHYWTVTSECPKCLRAELDRTREQLKAAAELIAWDYCNGGASEWSHAGDDNHYKKAIWGEGILRSLIDAEIAKLEGKP